METAVYNEPDLLKQLAAGSATAFDSLYWRYYQPVRANIFKIVKDEAQTDDILQEVFTSLWNKRGQFASYQKINGWLFVASFNRSMNVLRDQQTERLHIKTMGKTKEQEVDDPQSWRIQEEQFRLLEEAVAALPPQRKKVFELVRYQGKTYEQAAAELSISKHTVKEYLESAGVSIRKYIAEHSGESGLLASFAVVLITENLLLF